MTPLDRLRMGYGIDPEDMVRVGTALYSEKVGGDVVSEIERLRIPTVNPQSTIVFKRRLQLNRPW